MAANNTFLEWFQNYELTSVGLPKYYNQEIELVRDNEVSLYLGKEKYLRNGKIVFTTHRLLFEHKQARLALPLVNVRSMDTKSGMIGLSSPKVKVWLRARKPKGRPIPSGISLTSTSRTLARAPPEPGYVMYSFHDSDLSMERICAIMKKALLSKAWESHEEKKPQKAEFSTRSAGLRGIIAQQKNKQADEQKTVKAAFKDLDALMIHAQKMVRMAEQFAKSQEMKENQDEFDKMMADLGISNPVTKESAGQAYHQLLARQLAEFLLKPLERNGGMLSLVDVYCLYNRARGTELVSPKDLLDALTIMARLRLPVKLRQFKSGVMVAQLASQDEERRAAKVLELTISKKTEGIDEMEVCKQLNLSVQLGLEELLASENQGLICRDSHLSGTRFYPNFFLEEEYLRLLTT